jgi:hypothetical protein
VLLTSTRLGVVRTPRKEVRFVVKTYFARVALLLASLAALWAAGGAPMDCC